MWRSGRLDSVIPPTGTTLVTASLADPFPFWSTSRARLLFRVCSGPGSDTLVLLLTYREFFLSLHRCQLGTIKSPGLRVSDSSMSPRKLVVHARTHRSHLIRHSLIAKKMSGRDARHLWTSVVGTSCFPYKSRRIGSLAVKT